MLCVESAQAPSSISSHSLNDPKSPSLLQSSATLHEVRAVYATLAAAGRIDRDAALANSLLQNLVRCGGLNDGAALLRQFPIRWDVVSWSCLVSASARIGHCAQAFFFLRLMQLEGTPPNKITLISAITAASISKILTDADHVHDLAIQAGLRDDLAVCSALLNMYGKCGALDRVEAIFQRMGERNSVSWTSVISASVRSRDLRRAWELFRAMLLDGVPPDCVAFLAIAAACARSKSLGAAREIECLVRESGILEGFGKNTGEQRLMLGNGMIHMFGECGSAASASAAFESMIDRDVVSWNSIIGAYARNDRAGDAFVAFQRMLLEGIAPNKVTFVEVLAAWSAIDRAVDRSRSSAELVREARILHAQIQAAGLDSDAVIAAGLVTMFARIKRPDDAARAFDRSSRQDVVLWTTLIAAAVHEDRAMELFRRMLLEGFRPNGYTLVAALESCSSIADGWMLESCARELDRSSSVITIDAVVDNAAINMYGKIGSVDDAARIFAAMGDRKSTVSWNSIMAAFARADRFQDSLLAYRSMLLAGATPDKVSFVTALDACSKSATSSSIVAASAAIVAQIREAALGSDAAVGAALVNLHARRGDLARALEFLDAIVARDIFAWSAIVSALAERERFAEALEFFRRMIQDGVGANDVIFVTVLGTLGHCGSIEECCRIFAGLERDHGVIASAAHYGCVIDMLSRAGHLEAASAVIRQMPRQDRVAWMSFLGGCTVYGHARYGRRAAERLIAEYPDNASAYVALTNIYNHPDDEVKFRGLRSTD